MKAKIILFAIIGFMAVEVSAQTNFDILVCTDRSLTNAVIWSSTPAYLVIDYDGGITHEFITNLPTELQKKYHYDPAAAAAALAKEKQHALDIQAAKIKYQQYLASLRGSNQTIRIYSFDQFSLCEIGGESGGGGVSVSRQKVYLYGLPQRVKDFMVSEDQLKTDLETLQNTPASTPPVTVNDPNDPDPGFTAQMIYNDRLSDAKTERLKKIDDMKENLTKLEAQEIEATTITAYPTGQSYNTIPIWRCVSQ
jgi:hypothetical protein